MSRVVGRRFEGDRGAGGGRGEGAAVEAVDVGRSIASCRQNCDGSADEGQERRGLRLGTEREEDVLMAGRRGRRLRSSGEAVECGSRSRSTPVTTPAGRAANQGGGRRRPGRTARRLAHESVAGCTGRPPEGGGLIVISRYVQHMGVAAEGRAGGEEEKAMEGEGAAVQRACEGREARGQKDREGRRGWGGRGGGSSQAAVAVDFLRGFALFANSAVKIWVVVEREVYKPRSRRVQTDARGRGQGRTSSSFLRSRRGPSERTMMQSDWRAWGNVRKGSERRRQSRGSRRVRRRKARSRRTLVVCRSDGRACRLVVSGVRRVGERGGEAASTHLLLDPRVLAIGRDVRQVGREQAAVDGRVLLEVLLERKKLAPAREHVAHALEDHRVRVLRARGKARRTGRGRGARSGTLKPGSGRKEEGGRDARRR